MAFASHALAVATGVTVEGGREIPAWTWATARTRRYGARS